MKYRDHEREVRAIRRTHLEALRAEREERERACAALAALYTEELAYWKAVAAEWEGMYQRALARLTANQPSKID